MKWMLIVVIFGNLPIKTELIYDTLEKCLEAERVMHQQQIEAYQTWHAQAERQNRSFTDKDDLSVQRRIGIRSEATCVPHAADVSEQSR